MKKNQNQQLPIMKMNDAISDCTPPHDLAAEQGEAMGLCFDLKRLRFFEVEERDEVLS